MQAYKATCLQYTRCLKRTGNINSFKKKQERGTGQKGKEKKKEKQ
jgi:hypothetical protein